MLFFTMLIVTYAESVSKLRVQSRAETWRRRVFMGYPGLKEQSPLKGAVLSPLGLGPFSPLL